MWPDRVSNPGPLTYESGAQLTALRGPAKSLVTNTVVITRVLRNQIISLPLYAFYTHICATYKYNTYNITFGYVDDTVGKMAKKRKVFHKRKGEEKSYASVYNSFR